jgi:adenosylcobinamide-GDP ribazoletransferase
VPDLRDTLNLFARRYVLALQSSTRLRLPAAPAQPEPSAADADAPAPETGSVAHLPGAGWIVGLAAGLCFAVVALLLRGNDWGPAVAAVACTLVTVWLTGARHESALFRRADRLEQGLPGAEGGAGYGVMALLLLLAGKLCLLAALGSASEPGVLAALFAGHVVSRWAPLLVGYWGSAEGDKGALRVAGLWCIPPLLLMVVAGGVAFLLLALFASALAGYAMLRLRRRQPAAADEAGAVQQVCELAFYFGAAIAA